jgi:hypothetical protein
MNQLGLEKPFDRGGPKIRGLASVISISSIALPTSKRR